MLEVTQDQDKASKIEKAFNDKVVMWTGGGYYYDDVVRAVVLLDGPEMRPGTGQSGF